MNNIDHKCPGARLTDYEDVDYKSHAFGCNLTKMVQQKFSKREQFAFAKKKKIEFLGKSIAKPFLYLRTQLKIRLLHINFEHV